jgi:uncharacterized protein involved in exopolysaccharide biosynthesis
MSEIDQLDDGGGGLGALLTNIPVMLWQRRWLIVGPLVIGTVAGLAAAFLLPRSYRSTATLLVESQELPSEVAGAPVTSIIDQRIAKIRQQILSRPDLIDLIQNNDLYTRERASQPLSKVIDEMRDAVTISPVNADIDRAGNGGSTTIAFTLSFDYPEAVKAQLVAQDFVDRLMKLDASQTAKQAKNTVAFLKDQSTALETQINQIEGQIEAIKAKNGAALAPGAIMPGLGSMAYDAQIAAIQQQNAQLMGQASKEAASEGPAGAVAAAQSQLTALQSIYSDSHPDVKLAKQRLAEAKAQAAQGGGGSNNTIREQIALNNKLIQSLNAARGSDAARSSAAFAAQTRGPLVAEEVSQLESKAEGLRSNYQRVSTNLMNAEALAKMETEQRGERLTVVDPPVVPDHPASPNRPMLIGGGIAGGLAVGAAIAFLLELLLGPIRGVGALQRVTGAPPLVVIPVMGESERGWFSRFNWFRRRAPNAT